MTWPLFRLKECCEVIGGATPKREIYEYWNSNDIPWVTPKDISKISDKYLKDAPEYISQKGFKSCAAQILPAGSLLLTSRAPIGNVAITTKSMCTNQGFKSLVPSQKVDVTYLYYCMLHSSERLNECGNGATFKEVSKKIVEDFCIPLPPLGTQKQIAAILEKADLLRKDCLQMEQELNNLAQSMFMDMFGDPVSNPKDWDKANLRSISTKFNDGPFGSNLKTSHYRDSGVQVIRLTNIGSGFFKNEGRAFVSREHAKTLEKFQCQSGDIVIATLGDPNLRACIIPEEVPLSINKADCVHCVPNTDYVRKEYLVEFLNLPSTLKSIENKLHGQTRTRISSGQLAELDVLIPPLPEQDKFMNAIWRRDKELKRVQSQAIEFEDLFNSLMQKAFSGELRINNKAA